MSIDGRLPVLALPVFLIALVAGSGLVVLLTWQPERFTWTDLLAATGGDVPAAQAWALHKASVWHPTI